MFFKKKYIYIYIYIAKSLFLREILGAWSSRVAVPLPYLVCLYIELIFAGMGSLRPPGYRPGFISENFEIFVIDGIVIHPFTSIHLLFPI